MCTESFPGLKRPRRILDHPPPSRAEVKERVELVPLLPLGAFVACATVKFTFAFEIHYVAQTVAVKGNYQYVF